MVPLAAALVEKHDGTAHAFQQSAGAAMREAVGHRGYVLLTLGFFVCGFQVVFVGVHLPAYLADHGIPPHVAVTALALIGLFNIVGTYTTGWLGGRMPKRYILSAIYFGRAVVIALFLWLPLTQLTRLRVRDGAGPAVAVHGAADQRHRRGVFGVRYLAMLSGFTFFSHQIGSFLGAWLGGRLYDTTGSYDVVWWLSIALGVIAGLINLPIDEREIARPVAAPRAAIPTSRLRVEEGSGDAGGQAYPRAMTSTASVMMPSTPHSANSAHRAQIVRRVAQHAPAGGMRGAHALDGQRLVVRVDAPRSRGARRASSQSSGSLSSSRRAAAQAPRRRRRQARFRKTTTAAAGRRRRATASPHRAPPRPRSRARVRASA